MYDQELPKTLNFSKLGDCHILFLCCYFSIEELTVIMASEMLVKVRAFGVFRLKQELIQILMAERIM